MKRVFTLVLCLGIVLSASLSGLAVSFNKTGYPIVDEKLTLKFVAPKAPLAPNYDEMELIKRLEEETNVHIIWENIPEADYQTAKNLILASGDLPDAFYKADFTDYDLVTYGQAGLIIPLEDLIEEYAPNIKALFEQRPELRSMVTAPDGHIYSLPRAEEMGLVSTPFFLSINTAWLERLGLEMPTTLEEFADVLRAFRDQDPNGNGIQDEIPFSFMFDWWCADIGDLFGAFGMPDNSQHRIVRDGKVIFTAIQPEYKEAIQYFHGWYKEGLIDPESFTQNSSQYLAKGKTDPERLGAYIWWETEEVVGPERAKDYALVPPLEGPNGHRIVGRSNNSEYNRAAFVITAVNKYPEITMRWIDRLYEPYMSAQVNWGPLGIIYELDENGMLVNLPLPEGVSMGEYRQRVAPTGVGVVLREHFGTVVDMEPRAKQRLKDIEEIYAPYQESEHYPMIFFSPEELERINILEQDILDFVNLKRATWIVDGGIEEEWESYLKELDRMGLPELMEVYQAGLDRFNANQ